MVQVQLKLRLRPAQERQLERWLWRLTGAYNWAIRKIEQDAVVGVYYSAFDLNALVSGHGKKIGVSQEALRGVMAQAHVAWQRCFRGQCRKPRFKGRRNRLCSIVMPDGGVVQPRAGRVNIPTLGRVRFHAHDIPDGHLSYAVLVKRASGWYACLFIKAEPKPINAVGDGQIGIDPGFSSLLTLSTGEVVNHPHEWRRAERRLGQAQRGNQRRLAARLAERVANRRKDRNHKLSHRLVSENRTIAWSKDRTAALARIFGKSVGSAAHSQLRRYLAYKCRAGGREFIEVDSRNSTRTCSVCGARSGPTGYAGLSVRHWVCACGAQHDRDCNAAINTLKAGLGTSHESRREAASEITTK